MLALPRELCRYISSIISGFTLNDTSAHGIVNLGAITSAMCCVLAAQKTKKKKKKERKKKGTCDKSTSIAKNASLDTGLDVIIHSVQQMPGNNFVITQ